MHLETSISIDFKCRVPKSIISAPTRDDPVAIYRFKNSIEWVRKPLHWEALEEFLRIPRDSDNNTGFIAGRRNFYENWGWLQTSNDQVRASENSATFASFLNILLELHVSRLNGNLETIDLSKFRSLFPDVPESFAQFTSTTIDGKNFQSPELKSLNLITALFQMWFFGSQRFSHFKQCARHRIVGKLGNMGQVDREGLDETRCSVWFYPTRKDKKTCSRWCGDWMKNYNRKQKKEA